MIILFQLLFISSVATGDIRSGNYKIATILKIEKISPQRENDIIKSENDTLLTPIDNLKGIHLRSGHLILRKKDRPEEYSFYKGLLDTIAFSIKPPLFSFNIPKWATLEEILQYRFYKKPTEAIGSDEVEIYFDNERIYSRFFSHLYYFRNGIWFPLVGTAKKPMGSLNINSEPPGADVYIDGLFSGMTTPCTLHNLLAGEHTIELRLSNYRFFNRRVEVISDSIVSLSFELISDMDTIFITGEAPYSLLLLPEPPADKPYILDKSINIYNCRIRVAPGSHRLQWKWEERYVPLDTVIDIPEGKVVYFDYIFKMRYGMIRIVPFPPDAEVCIDQVGCSTGERIEELPVNIYRVNAYRYGFRKITHTFRVNPDTITTITIDMSQVPDGDGDGYLDSLDQCPEKYGLFNGCPTLRMNTAVKGLAGEIKDFIDKDSLVFGVSVMGFLSKTPINRNFRNFLSVFSSGKTGGMNNYKGFTMLNTFSVMYRGIYGMVELGQWAAGLQYQREDSLVLGENYVVLFDSLIGSEPHIYLPSTAISFGFHYNRSWLNIAYSIGYQWEDIVIDKILNLTDYSFERVIFNNDWWFHQLNIEVDFNRGHIFVPSIYWNIRLPLSKPTYSRWIVINGGFSLKIFTNRIRKKL
ncbi:MAG: PEGA domain-containing protein [Chitinispirillaceae bacterium]|nr:PEGA domain-containing protein [Chitinispirillaceae bacterium]